MPSRSPSRSLGRRSNSGSSRCAAPRRQLATHRGQSRARGRRRSVSRSRSQSRRRTPSRSRSSSGQPPRRSASRSAPPARSATSRSRSSRRQPTSRSLSPSAPPARRHREELPARSSESPKRGKRPACDTPAAFAARPKAKAGRTAEPGAAEAARACGSEPGFPPDLYPQSALAVVPTVPTVVAHDNPDDEPPCDDVQGIVRRAVAVRLKYNPTGATQLIPPKLLGFHALNRDGIACNGDRCDSLLKQFLHDGFDKDEANRDNYAVEVSGPKDKSIMYNIEVSEEQTKLATLPSDWRPIAMTLSHSHCNQVFKNIEMGAPSDNAGVVDSFGKLSKELILRADKSLAATSHTGLDWVVFPAQMLVENPQALHDISEAANIKNGAMLLETEMQALQRLARHCSAETNSAQEVGYDSVQRLLAGSMPKLASSGHFKELFSLVITLGGQTAGWMLGLAEFYGQFVNADFRKLRFATVALMGTWPGTVRGESTAPLIVAILKACYACDPDRYMKEEHLEFISAKDIKLVETDAKQSARLDSALAALKYFNNDWMPALAATSRGVRIQLQGLTDIALAQAFLMKDTNLDTYSLNCLMKH